MRTLPACGLTAIKWLNDGVVKKWIDRPFQTASDGRFDRRDTGKVFEAR
jgi:hypothetical protein